MQLSAPFLVFGLMFNIGLGVLSRLMPQMQVFFVGMPLSILLGFIIFLIAAFASGCRASTRAAVCRTYAVVE